MKKVLVLIVLIIVAPAAQITTWIMPLLPVEAQDPIVGPPPTADPDLSTSGGIANTSTLDFLIFQTSLLLTLQAFLLHLSTQQAVM